MSDDLASPRNVFHFPPQEQGISEEERARRILVAAEHLAGQPAGVWTLWYEEKAALLGITPEQFAELIKAQIAAREKAAAEKLAQEKLSEQRAERQRKADAQDFREKVRAEDAAFKKSKTKAKAFADIVKLSADQHDGKIEELAKLCGS
jgi:hypothetical protein